MVVTEELIKLLSFCEAHKYKSMIYKNSVPLKKALKINDYNLNFLSTLDKFETPHDSLCFYDDDLHIAFSIGVLKHDSNTLSTYKKMRKEYIPAVDKTLSKLAISYLSKKGWEIDSHFFILEDEGYEIDTWNRDSLDLGLFQREAEALSFWIHGLLQKKFKPQVSEKSCSVCKLKTSCKNYKRISPPVYDDLLTEFVNG